VTGGMLEWVVGLIFVTGAGVIGSCGRMSLKLSHLVRKEMEAEGKNHTPTVHPVVIFCFAIFCLFVNPLLSVFGFWFASPTLLAPLAGLTFIWALILGPYFLGETVTVQAISGSVCSLIGCVMVSMSGPKIEMHFHGPEEIIALYEQSSFKIFFVCSTLVVVCLAANIRWLLLNDDPVLKFTYAFLSGYISGIFIFLKCFLELIKMGAYDYFFTYFMGLSAAATPLIGVYILNLGLKFYDALFILPIYHASFIIAAVVSSAALFDDLSIISQFERHMYFLGISFIFAGVAIVSQHENRTESEEHLRLLEEDYLSTHCEETKTPGQEECFGEVV